MKIESVEVSWFRSYETKQTLDLKAFTPGLYAVVGPNGAGKSTLFEIVHWVILNETSRGLKAGTIKNWNAKGNCEGALVIDGTRIERGWSPNYLRVDGIDTAQDALEKALQISPSIALHAFHFSQFEDFFIDLKPLPRMELYSEVLGLDLWERKADEVSAVLKKAVIDRHEIELEKARLEERHATLSTIDLTKQINEWEQAHTKELDNIKTQHKAESKKIEKLGEEFEAKLVALHKVETDRGQTKKTREDAKTDLEKATDEAAEAKTNERVALIELNEAKRVMFDFKIAADKGVCPTCSQTIPASHRREHAAHLTQAHKEAIRRMDVAETLGTKAYGAEKIASANVDKLSIKISELDKLAYELEKDAKVIRDEQQRTRTRVQELEKKQKELASERNPFVIQTKNNKVLADEAKKQAGVKQAEIDDAHRFEAALAFWQKGFKEIRFQVMQESLDQLNAEVNESLHDLGLEDWEMHFEVEQETKKGTIKRGFLCTIKSPDSPETGVPWESWSGGESQRLRVASELGVANMISAYLGLDIDTEFWDEPSTWLNDEGIKDLLAVLQERAQRYQRRIFLADHRTLDFPFDGTIEVEKTERGSVWTVTS
jgi:DNA repair exonuclease SbcCD ATPase subunit